LANVILKHVVGHAELSSAGGIQILFFKVIAISAIQVADCAMGFGHDVNRLHRCSSLLRSQYGQIAHEKAHETGSWAGIAMNQALRISDDRKALLSHEAARLSEKRLDNNNHGM
jgi:hypothetical protein